MKIRYVIIILLSVILLTACNSKKDSGINSLQMSFYPSPISGYRYIDYTDCGNGMLHKENTVLWYYDYETGIDLPLCSNPSCKHNDKECSAYYAGRSFIYNGKIIEIINRSVLNEENGFHDYAVINMADFDGYNRKNITTLDYARGETLAYRDKLFIACEEWYYEEGDDLNVSSNKARIYLMEISLETMEITFISECLVDGFFPILDFYGINEDKLYFMVSKYDDIESFENNDSAIQMMTYDINSKEINTADRQWKYCLENCIVYYTGNSVQFVTDEKTAELISDIHIDTMPLYPDFAKENNVYFTSFGNDISFFKYDLTEECLYEAQSEIFQTNRILAVLPDGYVVKENDKLSLLNSDNVIFNKIDTNRYNEVCSNYVYAHEHQ